MSRMLIRVIDHDQKVFNIIDNGGNYKYFTDPRCDDLFNQIEEITDSTKRCIEALPFPDSQFSEDSLSKDLLEKGYIKAHDWCPTRRIRNYYLPGVHIVDNALSVYQNLDRARERNEWCFFNDLGMRNFRRVCDSVYWMEQIRNRHVGRHVEDAAGIPVLMPASRRNQIDIIAIHCDLNNPEGFAVFRYVFNLFEKVVPVIIVVPRNDLDLSITVKAMRMGAEAVVAEADITSFKNAVLDARLLK
jgi:hypothetical protein